MPHLIIDRPRTQPKVLELFSLKVPTREESRNLYYLIEVLDILAASIFVAGSACFLPKYSFDQDIFLSGCILFVVGSLLYALISIFTMLEAYATKGRESYEMWESTMYVLGALLFTVGTILYWPSDEHCEHAGKDGTCKSLSHNINKYDRELIGTYLFIAGSLTFATASFINALNLRHFMDFANTMLTVTTGLYMAGSVLFAMGSIAFMPGMGCDEDMVTLGAGAFVLGSVLFVVGGLASLRRTVWILSFDGFERDPIHPGYPSSTKSTP